MIEYKKPISIDIMRNGIFVKTLRIPFDEKYVFANKEDGTNVLDSDKIKEYIETKMPTLKNKDYQIFF